MNIPILMFLVYNTNNNIVLLNKNRDNFSNSIFL